MKEAPLLEVQRPLAERLAQLVAIYGSARSRTPWRRPPNASPAGWAPNAPPWPSRRLIGSDWAAACRQMLDYYDRCYDHELEGRPCTAVDLGGLGAPPRRRPPSCSAGAGGPAASRRRLAPIRSGRLG